MGRVRVLRQPGSTRDPAGVVIAWKFEIHSNDRSLHGDNGGSVALLMGPNEASVCNGATCE